MTNKEKISGKLETFGKLVTDIRVIVTFFIAASAAGGGMWAWGDPGAANHVTAIQADSISKANDAPIVIQLERQATQLKRQDTALIDINFKLDVMMTDEQKQRADSLKRAALRNINYGGSP